MTKFRALIKRLMSFFRRDQRDADLAAELESHLQFHIEDNLRAGMSPEEARRQALIKLGGLDQTKESVRAQRGFPLLDSLLQDTRFALRMLRKNPGFTAVAVLTLALGIGANTAIFSAVNGLLLRPLPYPTFARLVEISTQKISGGAGSAVGLITGVSQIAAQEIEKECPAFEAVTKYEFAQPYTLTDTSSPEKLSGAAVSGNFFTFFGVRPLLGRPILPADTKAGNHNVVVLSYQVWRELFGADSDLVGTKITLNNKPYEIVGVMPRKFDMGISPQHGIWVPLIETPIDSTDRASRSLSVLARLNLGVPLGTAQTELKILASRAASAYPESDGGWTLVARDPFQSDPQIRDGLLLLLGAAGFVILIACVNVGGILLARSWTRQREIAIRKALGASRLRLIRQFLSESTLLSVAAGGLGLLIAAWAIRLMRVLAAPYTSNVGDIQLDFRVLVFTISLSLLATTFSGLAPALYVSSHRFRPELKDSFLGMLSGFSTRRPRRLRSALVIVEVALAMMLVIAATLVARSFEKLTARDLGFRTDHILTLGVNFSEATCNPKDEDNTTDCQLAVNDLLERIRSLRGVKDAAAASGMPGRGAAAGMDLTIEGRREKIGFSEGSPIFERGISPGYFSTTGMQVLQGRSFSSVDVKGNAPVAIVNRTFAKQFLSDRPLGKHISASKDNDGRPKWMTIVGEVDDSHDVAVGWRIMPEIYLPYLQSGFLSASPTLIVRTASDPMSMADALRQQIWAVDKDAPVTGLATMDQIVSDAYAQPKFQAVLLGSFGALGMILAMIGIYGVLSYSVSQRTNEIGVRMTLGARRGDVLRMVIREGMALAGTGIIIGVFGALALTRVLRSMLFEVKPTDPATFAGVTILLSIVAIMACYIPARRAARVDPMVALRHE
jgi:putative ABC transport system permease protein